MPTKMLEEQVLTHLYRWFEGSTREFICGKQWRYATRDYGTYGIEPDDVVTCLACSLGRCT